MAALSLLVSSVRCHTKVNMQQFHHTYEQLLFMGNRYSRNGGSPTREAVVQAARFYV